MRRQDHLGPLDDVARRACRPGTLLFEFVHDPRLPLWIDPSVRDAVGVCLRRGRADVAVHAVLLLHEGAPAESVVRTANRRLAAHQQIRGHSLWPDEDFPRTLTLKPRRPVIEQRLKEPGHAVRGLLGLLGEALELASRAGEQREPRSDLAEGGSP